MNHPGTQCSLESVIATADLNHRAKHRMDSKEEQLVIQSLTQVLAKSPEDFFGHLVTVALKLSGAGSTGISLLNEKERRFVWPALAGKLVSYLGSGTPSDFGPCGTVLDRQASVLFIRPDKHFTYLATLTLPLEEVLLIPFFVNKKAVGTIWAVLHEPGSHFDAEHRRLLEDLSQYATEAYRVLAECGALTPLLEMTPVNKSN